jgi:exopolysaccharide production protein ExoQ
MTELYREPQFVTAPGTSVPTRPRGYRLRDKLAGFDTPVSHQIISWLLLWPVLSQIARQTVYFSGPARTTEAYRNGAAMAGARGAHPDLYVYLFFLVGFVLVGYRQVWAVLRANLIIPALLALAVCSALWSVSPIITLQMWIQVGLCTLFACYLSARMTSERLMSLMMFFGVVAAALSLLFALVLPRYAITDGATGAWQGICSQKNALGTSMAFLLTPVFFTDKYGIGRKLLYSTVLLFLIFKSQSRGAWCDTAAMLLFVASLNLLRKMRARELVPILLVAATAGVVALALAVHFWPLLAAAMGKDPSMTGRTEIYAEVWRSIMKRPVLGYGFGAFWYAGNFEVKRIALAIGWPNIGYAENGFLELALEMGLLGAGLVVVMMAKATVQGMRLLRSPQYSPRTGWFITMLFLVAITNIDAGWFMTSETLDWVVLLIACIGLNAETHRTPFPAAG